MRKRVQTARAETSGMRSYALQQTRTLLRRLAFQVSQTGRRGDADSVHDLRVAIRRFSQCLRVFEHYLPKPSVRKIRHSLKTMMARAAAVRDLDIAAELLHAGGIPKHARVLGALDKERRQAEEKLLGTIRRSCRQNFSAKWRVKLEL